MTTASAIKIRQRTFKPWRNSGVSVHPVVQRVLAARDITSAEEAELSLSLLASPDSLLNIDAAACLLADAMSQHKKILVIGDFDADGATSTALALRVFKAFGYEHVGYLVPDRFKYGYGLSPEIVDEALREPVDLIVTVDNGIASFDGVLHARQSGIQVLLTDHHLQAEGLPEADVIVNPNQHADNSGLGNLAGIGVIYYVMIKLRQVLNERGWFAGLQIEQPNMARFLDLVALGTVADVVPLDRNNRILVAAGLKRIRAGYCVDGITALLQIAGRNPARTTASDLGFCVGPRINAAGRLEDMSIGIECLLATGTNAEELAERLHQLNLERREIEQDMLLSAEKLLEKTDLSTSRLPFGIALYDPEWHQGVIGILASRIKESLHRPVIAFAPGDEGTFKGSARSVPGVHIRDRIAQIAASHPGMILKFGGHAMAAGLTLNVDDFRTFQVLFDQEIRDTVDPAILDGILVTDGKLEEDEMTLDVASELENAGPWGQAFPEPVFQGEFRVIQQRILKQKHYKLVLGGYNDFCIDAIAFNQKQAARGCQLPDRIELLYRLVINEFRGNSTVQLLVEKILTETVDENTLDPLVQVHA